MFTRRNFLTLLGFTLILMLVLAACERPLRGGDDATGGSTDGQTTDSGGGDTGATDAGATDTGATDAGATDAGATDAGATDAGATDSGATDAGATDAGATDAGATDAGATDAGATDAGATDAGTTDAGATDAGATDAGATDAGTGDAAATPAEPRTHVVQTGETLFRIGLQYSVSWVALAEANDLANANTIYPGQVLVIPGGETADAAGPATGEITHLVQRGENLYRIGVKYNISWVEIAEANGLVNPNRILAGQVLKIPASAPGPSPHFVHTVKSGETLFLIALQYGVLWTDIAAANDLASPFVIFPGQQLQIPGD